MVSVSSRGESFDKTSPFVVESHSPTAREKNSRTTTASSCEVMPDVLKSEMTLSMWQLSDNLVKSQKLYGSTRRRFSVVLRRKKYKISQR